MSASMDDDPIKNRVIALGGMLQALAQVRRIADTGQSESTPVQIALDSVFRIDAADVEAVYGDAASLRTGLRLLRDYLANTNRDEALGKLGLAVLHLERRFSREPDVAAQVGTGIQGLTAPAQRLGSAHPDVVAGLGSLYADTVSTLKPRVMVQGNPHYLGQAGVVAEIRALLLAALRSAVLWRQCGGSLWDFVFRRREMAAAIDSLLG